MTEEELANIINACQVGNVYEVPFSTSRFYEQRSHNMDTYANKNFLSFQHGSFQLETLFQQYVPGYGMSSEMREIELLSEDDLKKRLASCTRNSVSP